MPRTGIDAAAAAANRIDFEYFLRIDLLAETIRYTTRPADLVYDIDGSGAQTWSYYDFQVGQIAQGVQSIMEVSFISIANLDAAWSPRIFGTDSPRDRPVYLYEVQLDKDDHETVLAITQMFGGRIEGAEFDGNRVRISLVPKSPAFIPSAAGSTISPKCGYDYKDPDTCQAVSANTTCDKTRANCAINGNLVHFGGFDLMPDPEDTVTWGGTTIKIGPPLSADPVVENPWTRPPDISTGVVDRRRRADFHRGDPHGLRFRGGASPTPPSTTTPPSPPPPRIVTRS